MNWFDLLDQFGAGTNARHSSAEGEFAHDVKLFLVSVRTFSPNLHADKTGLF